MTSAEDLAHRIEDQLRQMGSNAESLASTVRTHGSLDELKIILKALQHYESGEIDIVDIDEPRDTHITIGCHRETRRLERMMRVYLKALTLARSEKRDADLVTALLSLHDVKGMLTATWRDVERGSELHAYVDHAWEDEAEILAKHVTSGGVTFYNTQDRL